MAQLKGECDARVFLCSVLSSSPALHSYWSSLKPFWTSRKVKQREEKLERCLFRVCTAQVAAGLSALVFRGLVFCASFSLGTTRPRYPRVS